MKFLNKYKTPVAISGVVIILVLIRALNVGHFKNNISGLAQQSVNHSVIISENQINQLGGDIFLVRLDRKENILKEKHWKTLNVAVDSVLAKKNLKKIFSHKGPVLLISSEIGVSARIWMVLSQMGRRDILIFTDDPENEVFKNKFLPDTLKRQESEAIK